ncbi:helix-turn-helix transcriptional regulator [Acrocarpospora sp. B8E8]|uniref:helix-turn-helix transcriptional regulator n=1 Tax=Acrocarpospora sp. B8E8 TaxID=3153572 RepID=UPI00325F3F1F
MPAAQSFGSIQDFSRRMRSEGAPIDQIAAALIETYALTPLAAYRHAHGLSQAQAAAKLNARFSNITCRTAKTVSYWENWPGPGASRSPSARPPSLVDLQQLAKLYGCLVDDLLTGPRSRHHRPHLSVPYSVLTDLLAALPAGPHNRDVDSEPVVTLRAGIGEGNLILELNRRDFATLLASGGLAALLPASLIPPAAADSSPAATFRATLAAHQAGHHLMSPAQHIHALQDVLADIDTKIAVARPSAQTELRLAKAEFAEHISWLYREHGRLDACRRWADHATSWAISSGNTDMAAYMMLRNASVALDSGHHRAAGDLAAQARALWPLPPALDAVAHLYQARAHAATGIIDLARLDDADELLAAPTSPDYPAFLRFYDSGWADLQRATCYTTGGQPEKAITILNARITALPTTFHRDRALHHTRIGTAYAAINAPDAAAIAAIAGLDEARRAGSQHVVDELRSLHVLLTNRWPAQPKVREFKDAFAAA